MMEILVIFVLYPIFGGFLLFFFIFCLIRLCVYLRDLRRSLCFKRKEELGRGTVQLSTVNGNFIWPDGRGYIGAPDETINEYTICQPYVYDDELNTGMRMVANWPWNMLQPETPAADQSDFFPAYSISPNISQDVHPVEVIIDDPPNYVDVSRADASKDKLLQAKSTKEEPPPPTYAECMGILPSLEGHM